MILITSTFLVAAFLTVPSAQAQTATASANISPAASGHGRGIGVGAVTMLNGTSGVLATWGNAAGGFHVDGLFGLHRYNVGGNNTTSFSLGGRFWYHVNAASFADFSLGGGLGLARWTYLPGTATSNSRTDWSLELGGQIRAFLVPNVALIADLGLGMNFAANDDIVIGGQSVGGNGFGTTSFVAGTLGIAYFFE
jgi:hypothetical protein